MFTSDTLLFAPHRRHGKTIVMSVGSATLLLLLAGFTQIVFSPTQRASTLYGQHVRQNLAAIGAASRLCVDNTENLWMSHPGVSDTLASKLVTLPATVAVRLARACVCVCVCVGRVVHGGQGDATIPTRVQPWTRNATAAVATATAGTRRHQTAPDGTRRHQTAPDGTRRHQTAPGGTRRHPPAPDGTRRTGTPCHRVRACCCWRACVRACVLLLACVLAWILPPRVYSITPNIAHAQPSTH
jgi:hypothetical protein